MSREKTLELARQYKEFETLVHEFIHKYAQEMSKLYQGVYKDYPMPWICEEWYAEIDIDNEIIKVTGIDVEDGYMETCSAEYPLSVLWDYDTFMEPHRQMAKKARANSTSSMRPVSLPWW